jgi:hypothetical protein
MAMAVEPEECLKLVADLKKAIARTQSLAQEIMCVSHEIDVQLARSRKLTKRIPKVNFSQAIQDSDSPPPARPSPGSSI